MTKLTFSVTPIGSVNHSHPTVPRHYSISHLEATIDIDEPYREGLCDIQENSQLMVVFAFHESPPFTSGHLKQKPPHRPSPRGIFSTCSPVRPNPIGVSVVDVLSRDLPNGKLVVRGVDMRNGTPILDLKPVVTSKSKNK